MAVTTVAVTTVAVTTADITMVEQLITEAALTDKVATNKVLRRIILPGPLASADAEMRRHRRINWIEGGRMNRFLKLPLLFDPHELLKDLQACESMDWPRHFHTDDYSGLWSGLALRSASGKPDDIHSHPGAAGYIDTPLLGHCPYIAGILDTFECEIDSARLLRLGPGAHIKEHSDVHTGYQFDVFRVHIPIETSKQVRFLVGGHALDMRPGECWYADFSQPHSVENCGTTARTNLILDGKRNNWSDALFRQAGYDFDAEARNRRLDSATRAMVIARLSEMKTDAADRLIKQLEAEADADE